MNQSIGFSPAAVTLTEAEGRAPRADATRNRDQLLAVATRVFASADTEPSMRAIAREAGVGIATLYRHFPTRESLVDAVYRSQVVRLTTGARELLDQLPPAVAMRRWMDLFGDWIATKNGMLDTLLAMIETGEIAHDQTRIELLAAITTILDAGRAVDDLRRDVTAEDIAASLVGIFTVAPKPQREALASRLLDLLMDGLRPPVRRQRQRCCLLGEQEVQWGSARARIRPVFLAGFPTG
ncbi:helix-turn-helix domain-containing protein [Sorangium sp. So ce834]